LNESEVKDMHERMGRLEERVGKLEELPPRINKLEGGQKELMEEDKNIWLFLHEIGDKLTLHGKAQTETNVKVDGLTQNINSLRTDFASKSGETQAVLSHVTDQNKELLGILKSDRETAADLQKERETTRRSQWDGFWKWAGIVWTGAAAVLTALYQYFQ
jgi:chromosome segregation ATPase